MLKKFFVIIMLFIGCVMTAGAQKKEIALAKDNVKAGKSLAEAEASMRKLLADSANRDNEKIWIVLFDAVRKQYEGFNENMYLKQKIDTAQLFLTTVRMFDVLEGLDSVDAKPDKKGRVRLKYRKRHADYLNQLRTNLFNGGLFFVKNKDYVKAYDCFTSYVNCAEQPMFASFDYANTDSRLNKAAFYTVYSGYKSKNAINTLRYANYAQKDSASLDLTLQYMAETYRNERDTVKWLEVLELGVKKYQRSDYFFSHLFDYYFKSRNLDKANAICDNAIKADSADVIALFAKSAVLLAERKYDECINVCDRVISYDEKHADAYFNAGLSYYNQAVDIESTNKHSREKREMMKTLYRKAMPYMQKFRQLAPQEQSQWAMPLYTIYLNLNMGKEFAEIDSLIRNKK